MFQKIKHQIFHRSILTSQNIHRCTGCCTKLIDLSVTLNSKLILDKINLHFHCGELTVLIGPNGAGKSTLFKALLGEIPFKGELCFHEGTTEKRTTPRFGYVPQKLEFDPSHPITVKDLFSFSLQKTKESEILRALKKTEAENCLKSKLGHLSGGELQRVLLALALIPTPDILLLDEPVSALDRKGVELFYKIVSDLRKNYDLSIILVSHDIKAIAPYADRMILLNKSIICDGHPNEILKHHKLHELLGLEGPYEYS